jgi:thiol:disulfide interchange protein
MLDESATLGRVNRLLLVLAVALLILPIGLAQAKLPENLRADWFEESHRAVLTETYSDKTQIAPGDEFSLAVQYIPYYNDEFKFHIYDNNMPEDYSYVPTLLAMDEAEGVEWEPPVFPPGEKHDTQMWLTGQPVVLIKGKLAADAAPGPRKFTGKTSFTACTDDFCLVASEVVLEWELEVVPAGQAAGQTISEEMLFTALQYDPEKYSLAEDFVAPQTEAEKLFDLSSVQAQTSENQLPLWNVLLYALLGGLVLNFMPCVLPVVSIKVISLVKDIDRDPRHMVNHGLLFSLGILVTFLIGAIIIAIIQAAGTQLGWGNQFQSPVFLLVMMTIIFLFGLSLAGVFTIKPPAAITETSEKLAEKEGYAGSFFKGVLATVLGTPCVGPFLGPALAYAFTRQWFDTLLIFTVVGVGMAVPYLLMLPAIMHMGRRERGQFARKLLDSKTWLVDFERVMAFLMFGTVIYMLYVLQGVYGGNAMSLIWALGYLLGVAFAGWLWGRVSVERGAVMILGGLSALAIIAVSAWFTLAGVNNVLMQSEALGISAQSAHGNWVSFSRESLTQHISDGKTVLVDFTANWCPNCKTNEAVALNVEETQKLAEELGIVMMVADWTQRDKEIGDTLRLLGYTSIPLTAIFPASSPKKPILLDGLFSAAQIQAKMREASGTVVAEVEDGAETVNN